MLIPRKAVTWASLRSLKVDRLFASVACIVHPLPGWRLTRTGRGKPRSTLPSAPPLSTLSKGVQSKGFNQMGSIRPIAMHLDMVQGGRYCPEGSEWSMTARGVQCGPGRCDAAQGVRVRARTIEQPVPTAAVLRSRCPVRLRRHSTRGGACRFHVPRI